MLTCSEELHNSYQGILYNMEAWMLSIHRALNSYYSKLCLLVTVQICDCTVLTNSSMLVLINRDFFYLYYKFMISSTEVALSLHFISNFETFSFIFYTRRRQTMEGQSAFMHAEFGQLHESLQLCFQNKC